MKPPCTITVDGAITLTAPANGTDFQLHELYCLLDCKMIQVIPIPRAAAKRATGAASNLFMVLDEEGKLGGAESNPTATGLVRGWIAPDDYIVGKVLVCPRRMLK